MRKRADGRMVNVKRKEKGKKRLLLKATHTEYVSDDLQKLVGCIGRFGRYDRMIDRCNNGLWWGGFAFITRVIVLYLINPIGHLSKSVMREISDHYRLSY